MCSWRNFMNPDYLCTRWQQLSSVEVVAYLQDLTIHDWCMKIIVTDDTFFLLTRRWTAPPHSAPPTTSKVQSQMSTAQSLTKAYRRRGQWPKSTWSQALERLNISWTLLIFTLFNATHFSQVSVNFKWFLLMVVYIFLNHYIYIRNT